MILICSFTVSKGHNIANLCWSQGKYSFQATQIPNGNATFKVYDLSGNFIYQFNKTVTGGSLVYEVNQPIRTTKVTVKVTWSDGYVNTNTSGTNQCVATPIYFSKIEGKNVGNIMQVDFTVNTVDGSPTFILNARYNTGEMKEFHLEFPKDIKSGDVVRVVLDYTTNKFKITKL